MNLAKMMLSKLLKPFVQEHKFQSLKPETFDDDIELEEPLISGNFVREPVFSNTCIFFTIGNLTILSITVSLILGARGRLPAEKNAVLRPVSWWCKYTTMLNGTLFAKTEVSIAREEPSAENDAAWAQFEKVLTHAVTREEIMKLGKDPETVARFDNEYWGMGDDAYMVQLDVMHQIHCLNLLRKAAFAEYPGYEPELSHKGKMWWIHLGHCTDILLQNLQCNANTEVLTLAWVEDRDIPWPDFSVNRKCRDFNALVDWQRNNAVNAEKFDKMPVPKDAFVWPAPWKKQESELGEELGQHHQQEGLTESHVHNRGAAE
ncbi:hypothetical protein ETB97_007530 [Aspergillus alliaceus]|uniref:Uncharacterized protein n=1 Tax=Petromyces alliaceus TaxID=209559 RepID=A0A8H6E1X1_PETAA|nr:hypothetical protein ETB97_007530 [Aspergillus burnettii]